MNPNMQHHMQLDFDQIEALIKQKKRAAGMMPYEYPG